MESVNIHEAKTQFSKLVHRTESGESIVISRGGKPVAVLVPYENSKAGKRKLGILQGKVDVQIDEENWKMSDEELFIK